LHEKPPRERPSAWSCCPLFVPAAETCARTTVLSNIWTRCAVRLVSAGNWKKASNTPERRKRRLLATALRCSSEVCGV
jgi:hypothetical protein